MWKSSGLFCRILLVTGVLSAIGSWTTKCPADEPCEDFLAALREAGYFDVALEYLDDMQSSDLAPLSFRQRIPLAKVSVLVDLASDIRDPQKINAYLDQAEQVLNDFIGSSPPATLLADAQEQKSRLAIGRARRLIQRADSDRITAEQREQFQTQARTYLNDAGGAFEAIRQQLADEITNFRVDPQDPTSKQNLDRLKIQYVRVRLMSPYIKEQVADSYTSNHPQYRVLLQQAVDENIELFEKYRNQPNGIDGCISAARCYAKLGEHEKALGYLVDVFALPNGPVQAIKKRQAALVAVDCWDAMEPYPAEEVFAYLQPINYSLPPDFQRTPDGIRLRIAFAKACHWKAERIKQQGPGDAEERRLMILLEKEATNLMRAISRVPGPHAAQARSLLADWGSNILPENDTSDEPPKNLTEAMDRGRDIQLVVADLKIRVQELQSRLEEAPAAADRTELEQQVLALNRQADDQSQKALEYFELALNLADETTADDDLTNLRYLQSASYFQMGRYLESAIIGEFLTSRYPNNSGARQAAGLVCKSYWQMYRDAQPENRSFEFDRLKIQCELVLEKWGGSPQAETAALLMTLALLSEKDLDSARQYMAKIPEGSPNRALTVLQVGNGIWQQYVREQRRKDRTMSDEEMFSLREQAQVLLEDGVSFLTFERLTPYGARSALSLVELYLDSGQADAAIELLEAAPIAPLDLVKQKHPSTTEGSFRHDTYRAAIRAYLAKLQDATETLIWIEKSKGVLGALKNEVGDSAEGRRMLAQIYLTLAKELGDQFNSLTNIDQRKEFAQGLRTFLSALQENSSDPSLLLMAATMLSQMGQGLADQGLRSESKPFFSQAVDLFDRLKEDSSQLEPQIRLAIDRGRANSLSGKGEHEQAITQFGDILEVPENQYADIQIEAALAFQNWGLETKTSQPLVHAIMGGEKRDHPTSSRPQNTVWGWEKLAKAARRAEKHAMFAEAVFNLALCKFEYGRITDKKEYEQAAVSEILKFKENVPEMGGAEWKSKFNALEQRIRSSLGTPASTSTRN